MHIPCQTVFRQWESLWIGILPTTRVVRKCPGSARLESSKVRKFVTGAKRTLPGSSGWGARQPRGQAQSKLSQLFWSSRPWGIGQRTMRRLRLGEGDDLPQ